MFIMMRPTLGNEVSPQFQSVFAADKYPALRFLKSHLTIVIVSRASTRPVSIWGLPEVLEIGW